MKKSLRRNGVAAGIALAAIALAVIGVGMFYASSAAKVTGAIMFVVAVLLGIFGHDPEQLAHLEREKQMELHLEKEK